jgi:hypothetical protein
VIEVFNALICENSVLMLSDSFSVLTPCTEALLYLIQPFQWPHIYIPVLPTMLMELLEAPQVYLIGGIKKHVNLSTIPKEVLIVDLDNNKILSNPEFTKLPWRQAWRIYEAITKHYPVYKKFSPYDEISPPAYLPINAKLDPTIEENKSIGEENAESVPVEAPKKSLSRTLTKKSSAALKALLSVEKASLESKDIEGLYSSGSEEEVTTVETGSFFKSISKVTRSISEEIFWADPSYPEAVLARSIAIDFTALERKMSTDNEKSVLSRSFSKLGSLRMAAKKKKPSASNEFTFQEGDASVTTASKVSSTGTTPRARDSSATTPRSQGFSIESPNTSTRGNIQNVFAAFSKSIVSNLLAYRDAIIAKAQAGDELNDSKGLDDSETDFNTDQFLESSSSSAREFLTSFCKTQLFSYFLQDRIEKNDMDWFDSAILEKRKAKAIRLSMSIIRLSFLIFCRTLQ